MPKAKHQEIEISYIEIFEPEYESPELDEIIKHDYEYSWFGTSFGIQYYEFNSISGKVTPDVFIAYVGEILVRNGDRFEVYTKDEFKKYFHPEYKPCPFCSAEGRHIHLEKDRYKYVDDGNSGIKLDKTDRWYVECYYCNAQGPIGLTKEEAIEMWEKRK